MSINQRPLLGICIFLLLHSIVAIWAPHKNLEIVRGNLFLRASAHLFDHFPVCALAYMILLAKEEGLLQTLRY